MPWVDMNAEEPKPEMVAGVYPFRVAKAYSKTSRNSGEPMMSLRLVNYMTGDPLAYANVMLGGRGLKLGKVILKTIGVDENFCGELTPEDVTNKIGFVALKIGQYDGQERLEVDNKKGRAGFYRWDSQDDEVLAARELHNVEPF